MKCFLSSDFSNYTGHPNFDVIGDNYEKISFSGSVLMTRKNESIFIDNGLNGAFIILSLINEIPGFKAVSKDGKIFINGIEWDCTKCDLDLFSNDFDDVAHHFAAMTY